MCVPSHLYFSGGGEVFGFVGGALEDFSVGPSHSLEIRRCKKSLTVEPDELPFPKRPSENKFKTTEKQKLDFIFFPAPLYFLFRRGGTGEGVLVLVLGWY